MCAFAAAAVALPLTAVGAPAVQRSLLVVSTTSDAVNGTVTSPAALIAHPGPDGISLREAIMASDHATGFQAITFAPALAGKTITPRGSLPSFTHPATALVGPTDADGQPTVTLDAANVTIAGTGLLSVLASNTSISHVRIVDLRGENVPGIAVWAGGRGGEQHVDGVAIVSNVIDNAGAPGTGMIVGTPYGPTPVSGAELSNVTIARNVIQGLTGDGINVALPGMSCGIDGLVIEENAFIDDAGRSDPALELGSNFTDNTTTGTQIVKNVFSGDRTAVFVDGGLAMLNEGTGQVIPASGDVNTGTVIAQNVFRGDANALQFVGGLGSVHATGDEVTNVDVSDDLIVDNDAPTSTPIYVFGGTDGATGSSVSGVRFVNDTIAGNSGGDLYVDAGSGNQVSGIEVANTILWGNGSAGRGPSAGAVTFTSSLSGVDPVFAGTDDFHLTAGSPAIDAALAPDAPEHDLEDRARVGTPDIGAYEFGAAPRPTLDVDAADLGGVGRIASSPAGITCTLVCGAAFDAGTQVTLTALPATGSTFAGWSAPCAGKGSCRVVVGAATSVTATFAPPGPPVQVSRCSGSAVLCRRPATP